MRDVYGEVYCRCVAQKGRRQGIGTRSAWRPSRLTVCYGVVLGSGWQRKTVTWIMVFLEGHDDEDNARRRWMALSINGA